MVSALHCQSACAAKRRMRSPEHLLGGLRGKWSRNRGEWLAGGGEWPLQLPIQPPAEAQAAADWTLFDGWLRSWRQTAHGRVQTVERAWPRLGTQTLPQSWCFASAQDVAEALGQGGRWRQAAVRHAEWCRRFDPEQRYPDWPKLLARNFDVLADLEPLEFERLGNALAWLHRHPHSGLYPRQLPIEGIDSKWLSSWQRVLAGWLQALGRQGEGRGFLAVAGLRSPPERLRLRLLDPKLARVTGGLADITAPLEEIAALPLRPTRVLVVENRDTGLALQPLPGTVAIMALGYSVDLLTRIPWLAGAPLAYWGDIDSHGLAILDRLRGCMPQTQALLMDEATLLEFLHLCASEERPALIEPLHLHPDEAALYRDLRAHRHGVALRLEQERLPWDHAWRRITRWAGAAGVGTSAKAGYP